MDELEPIKRKIYVIRGQRVMLDYDLAALYGVETKALNQAVKRNIARFEGEEFMFQLTKDEWKIFTKPSSTPSASDASSHTFSEDYVLRSQIVTSSFSDNWGGNRRPPYAFTEIGYAAIQKRREAAGEKLPPPVKNFDKMHTRRSPLRPLLRRAAALCGLLPVCLLLTATLLLAPSCSEDTPQLDPENLVTTRLAADSSETADVPASFALEVDTAWQGTNYYDFDGNPLPPPGDSTTIAIPDDTPQGDAAGGV